MDPISSIVQAGILRPEGGLPGKGGLAGLKVGDVLTALVLEKTDAGEVLLSLGGEKIAARTETALLPGDRVSLRVEDLAGTVVLKLVAKEVPDARHVGDLIRGRIPQSMNVGRDYADLRTALQGLLEKSPRLKEGPLGTLLSRMEQVVPDRMPTAKQLKAFVESSGIFYERKLAAAVGRGTVIELSSSLKSLVLEARESARKAMEGNPRLREELGRFLDISGKVLKDTETGHPANTVVNRAEGQTAGQGGDTMKVGPPKPPVSDFSDLRLAVRHLLEKAPALKQGPLGELLARLDQALPEGNEPAVQPNVFVKGEDIPAARRTAGPVKGADYEAPAADLKALVLDAKETARASLDRNPALREDLEKFLDVSERVLKNTEIVQLANSLSGPTENTFWAVIPYNDGERTDSVDWEVRRGNGEGESEALAFSLSFNLSGLGKVKVDGLFAGNRLHCSFWSQDEEIVQFMGHHLEEFSRSVGQKGMDVGNLACGVARGAGETPLQRSMKAAGVKLVDRQA